MLRRFLKTVLFLGPAKRLVRRLVINPRGETALDILEAFPAFAPNSDGDYADKAGLTIASVNRTLPRLTALIETAGVRMAREAPITSFPASDADREAAAALKVFLDQHGSDKAGYHDYHHFYGPILKDRAAVTGVLEVGMGTNNVDVVSHMGAGGSPGASLRAFRDFLPGAQVFGADIDRGILFQEERIKTFFVDQTDPATFEALGKSVATADFDLIIDDGLHSPDANIETLRFGLPRIKVGGWMVVEDIAASAVPVFEVISALLPAAFETHILAARGGYIFAVKRLA
jgi:hypothetical protein